MRSSRFSQLCIVLDAALQPAALPVAAQFDAQTLRVHGSLEERDGVHVLEVHGTLEERGFTEGYLTGDRIVALFRGFALSRLPIPGAWNLMVLPKLRAALDLPDWVRPWCAAVIEASRRATRACFGFPSWGVT